MYMYMYMYCFYIITKRMIRSKLVCGLFQCSILCALMHKKTEKWDHKCGGRLHDTSIKFSKVAWNYVA